MTVGRRGRRTIHVEGHDLAWWYRLSGCGSSDCPQDHPHVLIAHASRKGAVVTFFIPTRHGTLPITPARIGKAVESALATGWKPGSGNGLMHVAFPKLEEDHRD